jgi:hypothetical protein
MQPLESLISALVESLKQSGLSIVEDLTGEYWITDADEILDASPAKHSDLAMRVIAPPGSKLRETLKLYGNSLTAKELDSLPPAEIQKYGNFIEYVKKNGFKRASTPVEYAVKEMNWIRVYGNTFDVQSLTDDNVKRVVSFLMNQYEVDPAGDAANEEFVVTAGKEMYSAKIGEFLGDQTKEPTASSLRKYTFGMTEKGLTERIKKIGKKKWRVYSKKGKNLGTAKSLKAAKKRLKDVEFFKRKG